jgi:hypothetical protein
MSKIYFEGKLYDSKDFDRVNWKPQDTPKKASKAVLKPLEPEDEVATQGE